MPMMNTAQSMGLDSSNSTSLAHLTAKRNQGKGPQDSTIRKGGEEGGTRPGLPTSLGRRRPEHDPGKSLLEGTPGPPSCRGPPRWPRRSVARYQQPRRYLVSADQVTRVAINADLFHAGMMAEYEKLTLDTGDLADDLPDLTDELTSSYNFESYVLKEGRLPEALSTGPGLRLGIGFPSFYYPKDQQQDRIFVGRCGKYTLVGVVNGHGAPRKGAELAEMVAQEMPRFVLQSPELLHGEVAAALAEAFERMHLHVCTSEDLDLRLTGAACTVLLADDEYLWVAHVGDCRAVLGAPDPKANAESFHFVAKALTQDHKLSDTVEVERVQEFGGEMRRLVFESDGTSKLLPFVDKRAAAQQSVTDSVYRLFLQDMDVPGVTLTRAFGDRFGHAVGVSHFPAVSAVRRSELAEGSFVVLGSGGLWATMSERAVANWIGRYFNDTSEAAESLASEAFRRWQDNEGSAKKSLPADAMDCFGNAVLFLGRPDIKAVSVAETRDLVALNADMSMSGPLVQKRPFALGPIGRGLNQSRKGWQEVKSADRTASLRRVQARGRLPEDDAD